MSLILMDETGLNYLEPGILVSISTADGSNISLGSQYTFIGGVAPFNLQGAVKYVATFYGNQAPTTPQYFYGNAVQGADTVLLVNGYNSSSLSLAGYAQAQANYWVRGWFANNAPNALALATGLASVLETLDTQAMTIRASERLPTSQGSQLDDWAQDYLGNYLPRYPEESDSIYYGRILAALGPKCTLQAISQVVTSFYQATLLDRAAANEANQALDVTGGLDVRGGLDVVVPAPILATLMPSVKVWDSQSDPVLAASTGIAPPQFVISLGFQGAARGWFLDHDYLDNTAYLIDAGVAQTLTTAPDPRLAALVNFVKAGGTQPVYRVTDTF